mmetsp:Transcript_5854/g.16673  ORF Transcript_5854/g.16673 Transcript_5854/m.16673 type:complete len:381 (-) Transcript_5854:1951-3093(-)
MGARSISSKPSSFTAGNFAFVDPSSADTATITSEAAKTSLSWRLPLPIATFIRRLTGGSGAASVDASSVDGVMTSDVRFRLDVDFSIVLDSGVSARTSSILLPDAVFEEEAVGEFDPDFGEDKFFALIVARLGMRMDSFLGALGFEGDSRTVVWFFSASALTETTSLLDEVEVSANGCFCLATGCDSNANGLDSTRMLEFCCCCICICESVSPLLVTVIPGESSPSSGEGAGDIRSSPPSSVRDTSGGGVVGASPVLSSLSSLASIIWRWAWPPEGFLSVSSTSPSSIASEGVVLGISPSSVSFPASCVGGFSLDVISLGSSGVSGSEGRKSSAGTACSPLPTASTTTSLSGNLASSEVPSSYLILILVPSVDLAVTRPP